MKIIEKDRPHTHIPYAWHVVCWRENAVPFAAFAYIGDAEDFLDKIQYLSGNDAAYVIIKNAEE